MASLLKVCIYTHQWVVVHVHVYAIVNFSLMFCLNFLTFSLKIFSPIVVQSIIKMFIFW